MHTIWHESRGKYGELRFHTNRKAYIDETQYNYYLFIKFDDETRGGDAWQWYVNRWVWKEGGRVEDTESIDEGACSTLAAAEIACEWVAMNHMGRWDIYRGGV